MFLSNLKGLFFYYTIIRKDLVNKLNVLDCGEIPELRKIGLSIRSNQKEVQVSDLFLFNGVLLLEFLFKTFCLVKEGELVQLSYFIRLRNFFIETGFENFFVYESLLEIYYLWFRSLSFVTEEFFVLPGMVVKSKYKRKSDRIVVDYFQYIKPEFFSKNSLVLDEVYVKDSKFKSTFWYDFTFCNYIPFIITGDCLMVRIVLCFSFNTASKFYIKMLLSGLRLFHRFKVGLKVVE